MNNISYVQATISCLPVIGPVVGYWNRLEVSSNLDRYSIERSKTFSDSKCNNLGARILKADAALSSERQKGRIFSACAVVGNVLTIALTVGLVAFKVTSAIRPATAVISICTFLATVHGMNYSKYNAAV